MRADSASACQPRLSFGSSISGSASPDQCTAGTGSARYRITASALPSTLCRRRKPLKRGRPRLPKAYCCTALNARRLVVCVSWLPRCSPIQQASRQVSANFWIEAEEKPKRIWVALNRSVRSLFGIGLPLAFVPMVGGMARARCQSRLSRIKSNRRKDSPRLAL